MQITYPANHSSGKNPKDDSTTNTPKSTKQTLDFNKEAFLKEATKNHKIENIGNLSSAILRELGTDNEELKNLKIDTLIKSFFTKDLKGLDSESIHNFYSGAYTRDIEALKEFGTNYAEYYRDGVGAIQKLLAERQGQVAGAFYKESLGDIDLVWGDSKMGLAHILERRTDDFIKQGLSKEEAQTKARELIGQIPEILEQSTIHKQNDSKIELITFRHTLVLGLRDDRKFIITELIDKRNKKRLGSSQTGVADTLTDETLTNKSLSSSQHLDTSTATDPNHSSFTDSSFGTSLKSETKNDSNPTTKDLIQQSKYISKIMDLNKKNNKGTLDKKIN